MSDLRIVLDTNVLVSALLRPASFPRQSLDLALSKGHVLLSEDTIGELAEVLARPKFGKYITEQQRLEFIASLISEAIVVEITEHVTVCRDPKDNKFLSLAVAGNATLLVTGDSDLLDLNRFRAVEILTPQAFVNGSWC